MSLASLIPSEWFLRALEERQPRKDFLCVLRKRDMAFSEALKSEANGYGPSPEVAVARAVEVISKKTEVNEVLSTILSGPAGASQKVKQQIEDYNTANKKNDKQLAAAEAILQEDDEILANLAKSDTAPQGELGPDGSLPPWEIGQQVRLKPLPNVVPNPTAFTVRSCLWNKRVGEWEAVLTEPTQRVGHVCAAKVLVDATPVRAEGPKGQTVQWEGHSWIVRDTQWIKEQGERLCLLEREEAGETVNLWVPEEKLAGQGQWPDVSGLKAIPVVQGPKTIPEGLSATDLGLRQVPQQQCKLSNFNVMSYAAGFSIFHYRPEAKDAPLAPGFFDNAREAGYCKPGDMLIVSPGREQGLYFIGPSEDEVQLVGK